MYELHTSPGCIVDMDELSRNFSSIAMAASHGSPTRDHSLSPPPRVERSPSPPMVRRRYPAPSGADGFDTDASPTSTALTASSPAREQHSFLRRTNSFRPNATAEETVSAVRKSFAACDSDGSGGISLSEMETFLLHTFEAAVSHEAVASDIGHISPRESSSELCFRTS